LVSVVRGGKMGDMADWQVDNMMIPDDWEDREIHHEWAKRQADIVKQAKKKKVKELTAQEGGMDYGYDEHGEIAESIERKYRAEGGSR